MLQRIHAYVLNHSERSYELASASRKRALFGDLHGEILEIGPGGGPNLDFFPTDVHWVGVEPNPYMHPYIRRRIQALGRDAGNYRIDFGDPQGIRLPARDASLDAVVGTLVLCSVPHPEESLGEVLRVLKPGGRFVFI